jgi:hypothetical protein
MTLTLVRHQSKMERRRRSDLEALDSDAASAAAVLARVDRVAVEVVRLIPAQNVTKIHCGIGVAPHLARHVWDAVVVHELVPAQNDTKTQGVKRLTHAPPSSPP